MDTITVLIADDHELVRDGIKMIVDAESDMKVVGEASDGHEAIELTKKLAPRVVLMDISMPVLNGLRAAATLKRALPEVLIITLTRHPDETYMHEMFEAGVSGYVLKQSCSGELTRAIREVVSGNHYLDPALATKVFATFREGKQLRGEKPHLLSAREAEVLRHVVLGYSATEIGDMLAISSKTVQVHKSNSMDKLGLSTRRDLLRYGVLQGWLDDI